MYHVHIANINNTHKYTVNIILYWYNIYWLIFAHHYFKHLNKYRNICITSEQTNHWVKMNVHVLCALYCTYWESMYFCAVAKGPFKLSEIKCNKCKTWLCFWIKTVYPYGAFHIWHDQSWHNKARIFFFLFYFKTI